MKVIIMLSLLTFSFGAFPTEVGENKSAECSRVQDSNKDKESADVNKGEPIQEEKGKTKGV